MGSLTQRAFRAQLWGPFAGLLGQEEGQEEEGRAAAPSATRIGRATSAPEGPAPAQHLRPAPAHSRAAPGKLLGTSPLSGGRLHPGHVPAQPARLPRRRGAGMRSLPLPGAPGGSPPSRPSAGPSRACPRRGCCAAPRRRACPPALTILQMEAMFLTVMSLKVAAIPHRHLYKVKTAPLMVGRAQEGRGGGGGGFCSGAGIKARGGDCTGTLRARGAARRTDLPALPPPGE